MTNPPVLLFFFLFQINFKDNLSGFWPFILIGQLMSDRKYRERGREEKGMHQTVPGLGSSASIISVPALLTELN